MRNYFFVKKAFQNLQTFETLFSKTKVYANFVGDAKAFQDGEGKCKNIRAPHIL